MKEKAANAPIAGAGLDCVRKLLWPPGESQGHVFAILDGARNPRIFGAVDAARVDRTCLYSVNLHWPGEELPWKLIGAAPYLVELEPESELSSLVISQGWHDNWGIFSRAKSDLGKLRRHFRDLLVVRDPRNRKLMFRYYDPRVLRVYLPSCNAEELRTFFGPVDELIVPGIKSHTAVRYRIERGRLAQDTTDLTEKKAPRPAPEPPVKPAAPADRVRRRRISFVVTARDEAPDTLKKTLDGLLETSGGHRTEILLIDDGSSDPALLARPGLTIVRNEVPRGVARSRRMGAALASGEVLVFCDAHMQFAPGWLERLLEHVDTGAFLCAAWWDYELTHPVCWGGEYRWCGERDYKAGKTPGFTFRHLTRYPGPGAVDVPLALGACYMVLRDSYDRMGGFSPYFRIWGKCEQDVSARAWITGVGAKCVTDAHVGHLSRKKFPYPVSFSDIEFNQVAMVRTTFEEATVNAIEPLMQPLPAEVQSWVDQMDFAEWRERVQSQRRMSDAEFFQRFVPNAPEAVLAAALAR